MSSPERQYTDELHSALGYWATWLPNKPVKVGDCGRVSGRVFSPEAKLSDFGIDFTLDPDGPPADMTYATQGAVDYKLQLSAGNQAIPQVPQGTAGMDLAFSRENAIVFVARQAITRRVAGANRLAATLKERLEDGDFPPEYAVATEVVDADSLSVLISSGSTGGFTVSAQVDLAAGLIDLANVGAGLSRVASRNMSMEVVAAQKLTPLFKLVGFKRGAAFFGKKRVKPLQFDDDTEGNFAALVPGDADPEEE